MQMEHIVISELSDCKILLYIKSYASKFSETFIESECCFLNSSMNISNNFPL